MKSIKFAWITGASRGLGEAIARRVLADGYGVVLSARDNDRLTSLVNEFGRDRAIAVPVDVEQPEALEWAFAQWAKTGGQLAALINAAGVSARAPIDHPSAAEVWSRVLRTNLDGTFNVTRAAMPYLLDGARIVNIASDLGKTGLAAYTAYCASKHGVIGLTRALALELAPRGITVNAVCPGWVETDMGNQGFAEIGAAIGVDPEAVRESERQSVPLGRFVTADEVAALVAFLLSDGAGMMTGQAIDLTGGA